MGRDDGSGVGVVLGVGVIAGAVFLLSRQASAVSQGSPRERREPPGLPSTAILSHSVREWEPLFRQWGSDIPIAAALAWLAQESGGNVCAIGNKPASGAKYPTEYGLSQLDANDPENVAIMSQAIARAACQNFGASRADWEVQLRPLTSLEKSLHASAALAHMRSAHDHAQSKIAGWGWDPNELEAWKMAKLWHAGPAYVDLASAVTKDLGRPPHDFAEFQSRANVIGRQRGYTQDHLSTAWNNVAHFARLMASAKTATVA